MIPYANDGGKEQEIEEVDITHLYKYEKETHYNWYDLVLLNKPLKVVIVGILVVIVAPILLYNFMFFSSVEHAPSDGYSTGSCVVPRASRIPCGSGNVSQMECHPQCCYDLNSHLCFHRYPSRFSYVMTEEEWSEDVILEPRVSTVPFAFQNSVRNLRLSIDEVSSSHVSLEFYSAQIMSIEGRRIDEKYYTHNVSSPEMTVTVEASQGLVFSTIRGPLIASNNIWEIAFKLTNETMYGLGELPLKAGTVKVIYRHRGDFSSIPLIFAKMNESYHGLLIDSEAPTEVSVLEDNQIVLRSITDLGMKLHVFVGPKPNDIMSDVMKVIGVNDQLEYWMLGAHVCSEASKTSEEALADFNSFMSTAASEGLPFDSHCGSAPIVFSSGCDQENSMIEESAQAIKSAGKRYVPQISPYIRYHEENETTSDGIEMSRTAIETCEDIVSRYKEHMLHSGYPPDLYVGSIGENTFVYPMYDNVSTEFMKELWSYEVETDGIILENNWPLDESLTNNETMMHLPYFSGNLEEAFKNTPKWNATRFNDTVHYLHRHNVYGNNVVTAFKSILATETPLWSSSQFKNGNVNINRQQIDASWTNLRKELIEASLGGISGHWLWSTPVCGDTDRFDPQTQTSLCVKWYMAATYMPLIKLHSTSVPTHPLAFTGTNKNLMVGALNKRLSLLPYFFTTLQSGPLLRPMFYQFPSSDYLKNLNTQYSVGDDLLIVPNLQPSQTHVHFWIPPGVWYELWGGLKMDGEEGDVVTLTTTEADFLTLVRGGAILVMQKDVKTTAEATRQNSDFSLTIALDCSTNLTEVEPSTNSSNCFATGTLFLTKHMTVVLETDGENLTIKTDGDKYELMCDDNNAKWAHVINEIGVYGLDDEHNNYDNHRQIQVNIDLCSLEDAEDNEIVFSLLN